VTSSGIDWKFKSLSSASRVSKTISWPGLALTAGLIVGWYRLKQFESSLQFGPLFLTTTTGGPLTSDVSAQTMAAIAGTINKAPMNPIILSRFMYSSFLDFIERIKDHVF